MIIVVKVEHKNFCFQIYICPGDSGGPTIWEDKWDKKFPNRAYLIGIISGTSAYKKKKEFVELLLRRGADTTLKTTLNGVYPGKTACFWNNRVDNIIPSC